MTHNSIHDSRANVAYSRNTKAGKEWEGMTVALSSCTVIDERGESCTVGSLFVGVLGVGGRPWLGLDVLPISNSFCDIWKVCRLKRSNC